MHGALKRLGKHESAELRICPFLGKACIKTEVVLGNVKAFLLRALHFVAL
jgi:hypothetical protein